MPETVRPDYVRCIARGHSDFSALTWCGKPVDAWVFVDPSHAAENGLARGRLIACPACVAAVHTALLPPEEDAP